MHRINHCLLFIQILEGHNQERTVSESSTDCHCLRRYAATRIRSPTKTNLQASGHWHDSVVSAAHVHTWCLQRNAKLPQAFVMKNHAAASHNMTS